MSATKAYFHDQIADPYDLDYAVGLDFADLLAEAEAAAMRSVSHQQAQWHTLRQSALGFDNTAAINKLAAECGEYVSCVGCVGRCGAKQS